MSDRTEADDIAALFQDAEGELATFFHADRYAVLRTERVRTSTGGWREQETETEAGRCALSSISSTAAAELIRAGRLTSPTGYQLELPRDTSLQPKDLIRVNGRRMHVLDVRQPGEQELFVVALVEED